MSGHLCEEPFSAEDALGSLKGVSLSPFYSKSVKSARCDFQTRGNTNPLPPAAPLPPLAQDTFTVEKPLEGHSDFVRAVCRLAAHTLASGSTDHTIKIWDLTTATCRKTLRGHSNSVTAVCRLDAHTLASGSSDQTIKIWDLTTGTCKQTLQGHTDSVLAVCRLDAHTLASGSSDDTIKMWGFECRNLYTNTIRTQRWCKCSLQVFDAHTLASGSTDNKIKIWIWTQQPVKKHYQDTAMVAGLMPTPWQAAALTKQSKSGAATNKKKIGNPTRLIETLLPSALWVQNSLCIWPLGSRVHIESLVKPWNAPKRYLQIKV